MIVYGNLYDASSVAEESVPDSFTGKSRQLQKLASQMNGVARNIHMLGSSNECLPIGEDTKIVW